MSDAAAPIQFLEASLDLVELVMALEEEFGVSATAVGVPRTVMLGAALTLVCATVLALAVPSLRRLE